MKTSCVWFIQIEYTASHSLTVRHTTSVQCMWKYEWHIWKSQSSYYKGKDAGAHITIWYGRKAISRKVNNVCVGVHTTTTDKTVEYCIGQPNVWYIHACSVLIKSKWICSTNTKSFLYRSRCGMTFFNWIIFFIVAIKTKFTCSAFKLKLMICRDTWNSNMRCANWKCAELKNFDKNIHTFNNTCKHRPISAIVVCCCCFFFSLRTFTLIIYYVLYVYRTIERNALWSGSLSLYSH